MAAPTLAAVAVLVIMTARTTAALEWVQVANNDSSVQLHPLDIKLLGGRGHPKCACSPNRE